MKTPKPIKGIPLDQLSPEKSLITTEESVLKFFLENPSTAFSIEMLIGGGFSTNIRKIVQRLVNKEILIQISHQPEEKDKWEYLYYLHPIESKFHLEKTENGWVISTIQVNDAEFFVQYHLVKEKSQDLPYENVISLIIKFPEEGEAEMIFNEYKDYSKFLWRGAIHYTQNKEFFPNLPPTISLWSGSDKFWDFDVESPGKRRRLSESKSIVESDRAIMWAGGVGFLFIVNPSNQSISIYPRHRTLDEEGNVLESIDVDYFNINYKADAEQLRSGKMTIPHFSDEMSSLDRFLGTELIDPAREDFKNGIHKDDVLFVVVRARRC